MEVNTMRNVTLLEIYEHPITQKYVGRSGMAHAISVVKNNDIHPIKGAERAHKLLIRLGEEPKAAKEISLAILFHTDSLLPQGNVQLTPLQQVVALADEADKQPGDKHHYKKLDYEKERRLLIQLDHKINQALIQSIPSIR